MGSNLKRVCRGGAHKERIRADMDFMTGSTEAALHAISLLRHWSDHSPASDALTQEREEVYAAVMEEVLRPDLDSSGRATCRRLLEHLDRTPRRLPS
jgi:hypothetical protein